MLQPVFYAVARPFYDKLTPAQQKAVADAALAAQKANDDGRLADETSIVAAMKSRGLAVDTPDLAPFRALADKLYADDPAAKAWNTAMAKAVAETP